MYKPNSSHLQISFISHSKNISDLPEQDRQDLEQTWAGVFYREFFCRINESPFAVLYADMPSRPNVPVNVLVGLDTLKAGHGWSDQEMMDAQRYNLQVRYALGLPQLGEGNFDVRTVYNFRRRVVEHMQATGENLIEKAFEHITDEQIEAYKLKTDKLRVDSTQIASNIRKSTRLRLLVEVLQRVHRILDETDQERYADEFSPYTKGDAGQYVYRVKPAESEQHLQAIGAVMRKLVAELAETYAEEQAYQILKRVFDEHYVAEEDSALRPKQGKELSAASLQSPDDEEATYRRKRGADYIGYVANATETCNPENDFQLIVKVQVEPNTTDDAKMLAEALPELKERTHLQEVHLDGGYNSADVDQTLAEQQVDLAQTAIRGAKPASEKLGLQDFQWEMDAEGQPQHVICPQNVQATLTPGRKPDRYLAYFNQSDCEACPLAEQCSTEALKNSPQRVLRCSKQQVNVARRRQKTADLRASGQNLRAAVEATMRSIKHPFRNGKVPVRGNPRISVMIIGSAAMSNVRRISRHLHQKNEPENEKSEQQSQNPASESSVVFFFPRLSRFFSRLFAQHCQLRSVGI